MFINIPNKPRKSINIPLNSYIHIIVITNDINENKTLHLGGYSRYVVK